MEQHRPDILYLMETKMGKQRIEELRWQLGFPFGLHVKSEGRSGGLALFWHRGIKVRRQTLNKSHIDAIVVNDQVPHEEWRLTGFYGEPKRKNRRDSWYLLKYLRRQFKVPWICIGDFNEILGEEEHFGAGERAEWQMDGFRDAVNFCGFRDLGYYGLPYTWDNKQEGLRNVKARLDRALVDEDFASLFGSTTVYHIQTTISDHCALLVDIKKEEAKYGHSNQMKPFRYENMWRQHEDYPDVVTKAWNLSGDTMDLSSLKENCGICKLSFLDGATRHSAR
jgi:exonuclease III